MADETTNSIFTKSFNAAYGLLAEGRGAQRAAEKYLRKFECPAAAVRHLTRIQTLSCFAIGLLLGIGVDTLHLAALPLTIPLSFGLILFLQLRMICIIAVLGGHSLNSAEVKNMVLACFVGKCPQKFSKKKSLAAGQKFGNAALKKMPMPALNQQLAAPAFAKIGTRGLVNVTKLLPFMGVFVGGFFEWFTATAIAKRSIKTFAISTHPLNKN